LKNVFNIRVINLSLGRPVYESYTQDPLCQAVEAAWKAGIVVVVAAGNDGRDNTFGEQGYGTINAPGNDPYVITVGAMKTEGTYTRTDDLIATYSSKGPTQVDHIVKPDILAPGNQVVSLLVPNSTLVKQYPSNQVQVSYYQSVKAPSPLSKNYFVLSGTSMAAPVVSGAETHRLLDHRGEHALEVERGAVDRVKDLADRGLPLERLVRLVEQTHVLDRDRRLVRERTQELDLVVAERPDLGATEEDRADRLSLAQQRCCQCRALAGDLGPRAADGVFVLFGQDAVSYTTLTLPTIHSA